MRYVFDSGKPGMKSGILQVTTREHGVLHATYLITTHTWNTGLMSNTVASWFAPVLLVQMWRWSEPRQALLQWDMPPCEQRSGLRKERESHLLFLLLSLSLWGQSETHSAGGLRKHEDGGRLHGKARASGLQMSRESEQISGWVSGWVRAKWEPQTHSEEVNEGRGEKMKRERRGEKDVDGSEDMSLKGENKRNKRRNNGVNFD